MTKTQLSAPLSRSWRTGIAVASVIASWILIWWVTINGNPSNSLHQSALSWAFALQMGVLAGLGFGAIVDYLPFTTKK